MQFRSSRHAYGRGDAARASMTVGGEGSLAAVIDFATKDMPDGQAGEARAA
jgi:hypothetical protein